MLHTSPFDVELALHKAVVATDSLAVRLFILFFLVIIDPRGDLL